jgi:antirestriction protein ArdC
VGIRAVNRVIRFLESRDVEVRKGRDNVYYPEDEVIIYNAQGNYNGQLYTLLHEAGHFLQSKSRNFTAMNLIYGDVDLLHTNYQKFRLLEQEMDAWDRGLKLAKYLKIKMDIIDYRKNAAYFIMQYVKVLAQDNSKKIENDIK